MASAYPAGIPSYSGPPATMDAVQTHPNRHVQHQEDIVAIAGELGVSPRGSSSSVRARLDSIAALTAHSGVKARRNANQTLTATALTVISFDVEDEDTDGFFAPTSTNLTVPAGKAGVYGITARTDCGAAKAAPSYIRISVGATDFTFPTPATNILSASITLPLVVGDVVTVSVYNSGAADGSTSVVWMYRVSV